MTSAFVNSTSPSPATLCNGCLVCGDDHFFGGYGSLTCKGCAGFFRRSIGLQLVYMCKKQANCTIDCKTRSLCRFCRFQKCLEAGMNPKLVHRRGRGVTRKRKRMVKPKRLPKYSHPRSDSSSNKYSHLISRLLSLQERQRAKHNTWFCARSPNRIEASPLEMQRASKEDIDSMYHIAILDSFECANNFPFFPQLSDALQKEILKEFSLTSMLLDQCCNTGIQDAKDRWMLQSDRVYLSEDFYDGLPEKKKRQTSTEIKAKLQSDFIGPVMNILAPRMRLLRVEPFESVLLKMLMFLECKNVYGDKLRDMLNVLRQQTLHALTEYEKERNPADAIERTASLLLLIVNIRGCSVVAHRYAQHLDVFAFCRFSPLVHDVLLKNIAVIQDEHCRVDPNVSFSPEL